MSKRPQNLTDVSNLRIHRNSIALFAPLQTDYTYAEKLLENQHRDSIRRVGLDQEPEERPEPGF